MVQTHAALRTLRDESAVYVSDADLQDLDTYARRIRGEIFFADRWLLVEGQAEYTLVSGLAEALGTPLDDFGIALIDAVNNGNPQAFASLARALNIPWVAVLDGDAAGHGYKAAIVSRGFDAAFVDERCRLLPAGDLEQQLIADGAHAELRAILVRLGKPHANTCDLPSLIDLMRGSKTDYSAELARRVKETPALSHSLLQPVRDAIEHLRGLK
jgi:putative ATP-dependent endonuclease of OLD family